MRRARVPGNRRGGKFALPDGRIAMASPEALLGMAGTKLTPPQLVDAVLPVIGALLGALSALAGRARASGAA